MDILTKEQRSYNMSMIKSKWTNPEKKIHNFLKGNKIRHRMHPKIGGNPDLILPERKTAVFIHGCFWHKCLKHFIMPKTRKDFWSDKINRNAKRDRINTLKLKSQGWKVVRLWEHDTKKDNDYFLKRFSL